MKENEIDKRVNWLLDEISPLTYHSDFDVAPHAYLPDSDTLHINVIPKSPSRWAYIAHEFGCHDVKYDRSHRVFNVDGQPRVDYSGMVWVRYVGDFLDGSNVAMNIWSRQPSHYMAERELAKYYGIWKERHDMEPIDVFRKFSQYND